MSQDEPGIELDTSLGYMLKAAASALHSALEAVLRPLGMTITHYSCLELLAQRPGLSNSELARGAFVTRQSMNVLLQNLERQGLVTRPAQPPAGRALPTELTARGRRQLATASAAVRRVEQDMLANLDASEQDQMRRLLTTCIAALTQPPASATKPPRNLRDEGDHLGDPGMLLPRTVQYAGHGRIVSSMEGVTVDAGAGVEATLNYLAPWSQRNRLYVAPGGHMTTTQYAPRTVRIANGRPFVGDFGLDGSGFTLLDHHSTVTDFDDAGQLEAVYVNEGTALVRQVTGADEVVPIGWVIRRAGSDLRGAQPPAPDVHVDVHPGRADARFAAAAPGGRPFRRAIMTSLWRAFSPPPQDWPLAILDYRSVDDSEGEPNLLLFVDSLPDPGDVPDIPDPGAFPAGSIFTWRPAHRWWYFPDMHAGEALLFKLHDTDHSVAWRAPHTAFHDATASGAHSRESVELRTVAFFY